MPRAVAEPLPLLLPQRRRHRRPAAALLPLAIGRGRSMRIGPRGPRPSLSPSPKEIAS